MTKNVAAGVIVAGVPARPIGFSKELDARRLSEAGTVYPMFDRKVYNRWPLEDALLAELDKASEAGGYYFGNETRYPK